MNSHPPRRIFMIQAALGGAALACGQAAVAAPSKIDESDPKAKSLGYKHDSSQVDKAKFPKHAAGEKCTNCMAWLGKPTDAWAECDLLVNKLVAGPGWCSSYVKLKS